MFVAKNYNRYVHQSGIDTIEIFDVQGKILWLIPSQYAKATGDPSSSLRIYSWDSNSLELYFYYTFYPDGILTISPEFDLSSINVKTGRVMELLPDDATGSFAFSLDKQFIAYGTVTHIVIQNLANESIRRAKINNDFGKVGWIYWSPSNQALMFHEQSGEKIRASYLNVNTLEQKTLFEFWAEEYWPYGWSDEEMPEYLKYPENELVTIDISSNAYEISVVGTLTPTPVP